MAEVFDGLGHPTPRRILDLLRVTPGITGGALAQEFDTTRIAVMHHLRFLEESGLVVTIKERRTRQLFHNPVPIQLIHDRWTTDRAPCSRACLRKSRSSRAAVAGRSASAPAAHCCGVLSGTASCSTPPCSPGLTCTPLRMRRGVRPSRIRRTAWPSSRDGAAYLTHHRLWAPVAASGRRGPGPNASGATRDLPAQ